MKKGSKRGFLAPFWGVLGVPLKRPKKGLKRAFWGLWETLWRNSGGVRRRSDRGLEEVGRGLGEKKWFRRVEGADKAFSRELEGGV